MTEFGFEPFQGSMKDAAAEAPWGRPVSAKWSRRDGSSGTIAYRYLVDASGRHGLMSTRYMKNRKFNQSLKNVALWGYWEGAPPYGDVDHPERHGAPYFEALKGQYRSLTFQASEKTRLQPAI